MNRKITIVRDHRCLDPEQFANIPDFHEDPQINRCLQERKVALEPACAAILYFEKTGALKWGYVAMDEMKTGGFSGNSPSKKAKTLELLLHGKGITNKLDPGEPLDVIVDISGGKFDAVYTQLSMYEMRLIRF